MNTRRLIVFAIPVALVVVVAALLALRAMKREPTSPYDAVFRAEPQPRTVKPVTEAPSRQSASMSSAGGTLGLEGDKQKLSLVIPEHALLGPEDVALERLREIENLPEGARFVAGADLAPDGVGFTKAATLRVQLPRGAQTDNLVAFAYEESGNYFHYHPFFIQGDTVEIPLDGFSGGGVIEVVGTIPVINPGGPERTAKQLLADVLRRAKGKQVRQLKRGEEGDVDPRLLDEARGILNAWYRLGVKPDLRVAERDDAKVTGAISHLLSWRTQVELFGLEEHFQKEYDEALASAARGIRHALFQAEKRCVKQKDPNQVAEMLRWLGLAQSLGLESRAGLTAEEITKNVRACAAFELEIDSKFTVDILSFRGQNVVRHVASGNIPLSLGENYTLTGVGNVSERLVTDLPGCTTGPHSLNVTATATLNINTRRSAKHRVSLLVHVPTVQKANYYECQTSGATYFADDSGWAGFFSDLHAEERTGQDAEACCTYLIKGWTIGKGEIFAEKSYQNNVGPIEVENTKLTLRHAPKAR